ncbi:MAG: glycerol-3-phosphate 1-O-acyltransferase PlsY [Bacillota bacterium]|nr:glycerol-3-phosphate 1-O-acyltransferase PlsY [Bacillota bacterium]
MFFRFCCVAAISYLLGSVNFSIIVSRWLIGADIRNYGSKNAGMTNSFRVMGGKKTLIVILGDVSKGALSVLIAYLIFRETGGSLLIYAKLTAAVFAVAGHIFPIYFGFKGGKGVLTTASVLLFFDWRILLALLVVFAVSYFPLFYVSLSSVLAAFSLPFLLYFFYRDLPVTAIGIIMSGGIIFMHRSNIVRLINGTEVKTNFFKRTEREASKK